MSLLILLIIPLLAGLAIWLQPAWRASMTATIGALLSLLFAIVVLFQFDYAAPAGLQMGLALPWAGPLGVNILLGIDAVSLMLIALTAGLMPLVIVGSFSAITERKKEYYFWLMVLQTAMTGVFMAQDLIFFYICFEFTLLPMFFLIAIFGSTNRARASVVFFLYTFTGSIITLAGLLYLAWYNAQLTGMWTFEIARLVESAQSMSASQQGWLLLALLCGFGVKVPLFPVHTWLPLAHTEAPTAGSVVLAAVLLKLGTYGLYRFALPMCPLAIYEYAPVIAVLCIIGIIYGALICWVQTDIKKLIAYSSVSHLGFCVLGLVALNTIGISGSIMYMINHGLSTGALFLCVGMIYERYHTRAIDDYSGLARMMPVWTFFMIYFVLASVGLPGLNGFVGEFLTVMGAFASGEVVEGVVQPGSLGPWYAAVAGIGMILAAVYLLYLVGRVMFGPLKHPVREHAAHHHHDESDSAGAAGRHHHAPLPRDLTLREILVLTPIAVACLVLGVKPDLIIDPIEPPVEALVTRLHENAMLHYANRDKGSTDQPAATITTDNVPATTGSLTVGSTGPGSGAGMSGGH